jgi:protein-S-isoprenylcysteine O-methyltransferase Ste14
VTETKPDTCGVVVIPPVVFAFCLFAGIGATLAYGRGFAFLPWQMRWVAGVLVAAYGGTIAVWGLMRFHRQKTPYLHHKPATALVMSGAYTRSRNPMYVGLVCALLGIGLFFGAAPILVSAFVMFAYLNWYVIPREEAYLARAFGEPYAAYCKRVKRWL